ncbi:MAG: c-type cytochrome [Pseudoxanthomonas sp.]|nr:c-type cytochrome [Pseudoxanthomonas sp.]
MTLLAFLTALLVSLCIDDYASRQQQGQDAETLGKLLFFDKRLSADATVSCATCHIPSQAFTDGRATSVGASGRVGTRNSTSLLDVAHLKSFFWDGRESTLADAVLQPFTNPAELGHVHMADVESVLASTPEYRMQFFRQYGRAPDSAGIAHSLSTYIRSLEPGTTRLERYLLSGDATLLSDDEITGLSLFRGKANCSSCHVIDEETAPLTDNRFHHAGVGFELVAGQIAPLIAKINNEAASGIPLGNLVLQRKEIAELGRFVKTGSPSDLGAFRTPTLRNVARTAPYMHDGSVRTLEAAVERELYYRGISMGRPISLTTEERRQLQAFLQTLSIE